MKRIMTVLVSGCLLLACNSATENHEDGVENAQEMNENVTNVSDKTSEFMTEAASGGMMEVQLGQLAQQKAQNQSVKDFGNMMVQDHSKANDQLKQLAAQKNITLPATLSDDHQKHVNELSEKTGAEFDKAYMDMMVDDHQEDVDKFKEAADDVPDAEVKNFAATTLPTLQKHLDAAKAIHDKMPK